MRSLPGFGLLTGAAKQAERNAQADFRLVAGLKMRGLVGHGQKKRKMGRGRIAAIGRGFGLFCGHSEEGYDEARS